MTIANGSFTLVVNPAGGGGGTGAALQIVDATPDGVLVPATEGVEVDQPLCKVQGGTGPYDYEFDGQPEGVSFLENSNADGSVTIMVTGTPQVGDAAAMPPGGYEIALTVTDSAVPAATASTRRRVIS